jgi:hypothetical protein
MQSVNEQDNGAMELYKGNEKHGRLFNGGNGRGNGIQCITQPFTDSPEFIQKYSAKQLYKS